jgi:putative ABC transport system permease protein
METLLQDLRYAFRVLIKSPSFTAIAVLTLALGIGANTSIFSVVNAILLRPLPFHDSSRIMLIAEKSKYSIPSVSYQNFVDWRDQSHSFESVQGMRASTITLTGAGEPERLDARWVTSGLFPLLGVQAGLGRTFRDDEDGAGGAPAVVISYGLWQRRFGGATDVLNKSINLDSRPYTIVGVLPRAFEFLRADDVYLPFTPWAKTLPDDRNWHPGILAIGRLKPGVSREQANTEMVAIAKRLEEQYPIYNTGTSADVIPLQEQVVKNVRPALLLLVGAVSFVLLIACANVANLLLARAAYRGREVAIRASMGAGRARLIRQLLTESILLSLAGGIFGLLLAWASLGPLLNISAGSLPLALTIGLNRSVLLFTILVSVVTGLVFGIAPALRATRLDLRETLNEGSRGSTSGPGHQRLRGILIASEFALAMLLLVGAGLLLRSFSRLQDVSTGFQPDHLLVADLPLSQTAYAKPEQRYGFFDRLVGRAQTLPGVRSVGAASALPVSGTGGLLHFNIYGRPPKTPNDYIAAGYRAVTANYFETLSVPLLQGRFLTPADKEQTPAVVVINATMAKTYFPGENPLGKRMQVGATPESDVPWMEVVGVVGDVTQGLGLEPKSEMYLPYRQADQVLPVFQLSVVLRTAGDPHQQAAALRSALAEIDPNQPLVKVRTMEDNMAATVAQPRFRTWLIGIFAGLALMLAAVGIYGVMSYSVTQRTGEIGIRITLGAQPVDVFRIVLGEGLRFALIGVAVGVAGGLVLTRLLSTFLYGVSATDPLTFFGVAILLIAVSVAACFFPARRATRVDPIVALRYE